MGSNKIGTQKETSLHASLKEWYAKPGDLLEVELGRYVIDIVRGEQLIEIQTGSFHLLKAKLRSLLPDYQVRIVHPIASERWIQRVSQNDEKLARRKSPKRGRIEDMFNQLVGLVEFIDNRNLQLEALLIREEITWRDDGRGSWRRKGWSIADRQLIEVIDCHRFRGAPDYLQLLPDGLDEPFTNEDLSKALKINRRVAERMTYCLRKMGMIRNVGQHKRFNLYTTAQITVK
jgi:hypothetical protein